MFAICQCFFIWRVEAKSNTRSIKPIYDEGRRPMDNESSRQLGLHTVKQDGDLLFIILRGPLALAEAQVLHGLLADTLQRWGHAYVLVDSSRGDALSADTRRWIAEWNQRHRVDGVAIFGANLFMRTMLSLVLNAIGLLGKRRVPAHFVKNEAEARAWLASLRTP